MRTPEQIADYQRQYARKNRERLSAYYTAWAGSNRERLHNYKMKWQRDNSSRRKEARRLASLKARFGPHAPAHNLQQLEVQQGKCDCCGSFLPVRTLDQHQDHNHKTSQLRGVLCRRCNMGLHYMELSGWKETAEAYLRKWDLNVGV